jgi:ATP-binding cassette subfamily B (MDR/TAP) protein 1
MSLNATEKMIDLFKEATAEAYQGAVSTVGLIGLANGCVMASMLLSYVIVTLFGAYLLYDKVEENGCDPSGGVEGNTSCDPAGVDVFGALMGISFGAAVLPQISVAIESFIGARAACYPAIAVIHRKTEDESDGSKDRKDGKHTADSTDRTDQHLDRVDQIVTRGNAILPKYIIDSSSDKGMKPTTVSGDVEFSNVVFSYPARQQERVLQDLTLKIEAGKTVALVGLSGSVSLNLASVAHSLFQYSHSVFVAINIIGEIHSCAID